MPYRQPRCPKCGRTPRYALPSLKRVAHDAEGKAIIENNEPVIEMAYRCRGCAEVFYMAQTGTPDLPTASKRLIEQVLEEVAKNKKAKENG